MRRLARALCVTVLATAGSTAGLPTAAGADGGLLRLAHLSPDTPEVDVYVDSVSDPEAGVVLEGVGYGTVSDYQDVPPGHYTVAMRTAGTAPDTPAVLSTTVEVGSGSARTVAGLGYFAALGLKVMEDDLTPPAAGSARMRVVAAAPSAGSLDVSLTDGASVASGVEFATPTRYLEIPGGSTSLRVTPEGAAATDLPLDLAAGSVYSVLVLDVPGGGLKLMPLLDAAGTGGPPGPRGYRHRPRGYRHRRRRRRRRRRPPLAARRGRRAPGDGGPAGASPEPAGPTALLRGVLRPPR